MQTVWKVLLVFAALAGVATAAQLFRWLYTKATGFKNDMAYMDAMTEALKKYRDEGGSPSSPTGGTNGHILDNKVATSKAIARWS